MSWEDFKIKLRNNVLAVLVLVLCLPMSTILSTQACNPKVIDFCIYLETSEKQVVVDEIIYKLESLGLIVNTYYYYDLNEWTAVAGPDYDITYGGLSYTWMIDDIFNVAYVLYLINNHMLYGRHHDMKLNMLVDKLAEMYTAAMEDPTVITEKFLDKMIDTFQKTEKRLWKKKYIMPFVQWEDFFPPFGMDVFFTEVFVLTCTNGRVFASQYLRNQLFDSIDRSVFLDYHALYTTCPVYEVYHLFQMSPYHDLSLPNY